MILFIFFIYKLLIVSHNNEINSLNPNILHFFNFPQHNFPYFKHGFKSEFSMLPVSILILGKF